MSDYNLSIIVIVLLFLVPVLFFAIKRKAFSPYSFKNLVKSFNRALIAQLVIAVISVGVMFYLDSESYTRGSNFFTGVIMPGALNFVVIGAFYYLPSVVILNIFAVILSKKNR